MLMIFCKFPKLLLPCLLALISAVQASAGFSSIYTFGDGVCTTTQSPSPSPASLYYGARYCNGPVWIEKISQLQGVTYNAAKNNSYFGHTSAALKTSVNNFQAPTDAATALFIVWTNDADFVTFAEDNTLWQSGSLSTWTTKINTAIADLTTAINTLYTKGARKIVMPNAVNISAIPLYNGRTSTEKSFFRERVVDYNNQFTTATNNLMSSNTGLVIYRPNVFNYFENVIAYPGNYGFVNATNGATLAPLLATLANGLGTNYVFWDYWHPTANFQNQLANFVNASIPVPDTTPPVLTLPGNLVREATGPGGAVVTFTTSANDAVSGSRPTTNTPPSGSTFPLGQTTVQVTATDAAGNTANGSFKVTVSDTTPPTMPALTNMVREATGPTGAAVTFTLANATDSVSGNRTCTATPPSGSMFPIGTTTVNVTASDAAGNQAGSSFKVTVVNMKNLLQDVVISPGVGNSPSISGLIQGGPPGAAVFLQSSADLGQADPWVDIATITLDSSGNKPFGPIADPQGSGLTRGFFRIKLRLNP